MQTHPVYDGPIPEQYAIGLGQVVARWAHEQWLLIEVLRLILGIDPKEARFVFSTGEKVPHVDLIRTLVSQRKLEKRRSAARRLTGVGLPERPQDEYRPAPMPDRGPVVKGGRDEVHKLPSRYRYWNAKIRALPVAVDHTGHVTEENRVPPACVSAHLV
jgi:hypothetical protein